MKNLKWLLVLEPLKGVDFSHRRGHVLMKSLILKTDDLKRVHFVPSSGALTENVGGRE